MHARTPKLLLLAVVAGVLVIAGLAGATAAPKAPPGSNGKGPKQTTTTTTTAPATTTTTVLERGETLLAAGDIASCASTGDEATAALLSAQPAATVITLGDNVYDSGTPMEFSDCYDPSWGAAAKPRTKPAPGNHDYTTPGAVGYYGYFGAAAGDSTKGYYSYDVGRWHVVSLNSNCTFVSCSTGSAQEQWLRADLAAHSQQCTLAYWHHPRFSSGTTHGSSTTVAPLWQALYDSGADVVLSGHEHNYERFAPLDPSGSVDVARGMREFVVGTGGRSHYTGFVNPPLAGSEIHDGNTWGVLELTLKSSSYDWTFHPIDGGSFTDAGTGTCH